MQRDRHAYVEYELGADDQIEWTPARGENKIKSKNAQDQSSTAGRLGGGVLCFPKTSEGTPLQLPHTKETRNLQNLTRLECLQLIMESPSLVCQWVSFVWSHKCGLATVSLEDSLLFC